MENQILEFIKRRFSNDCNWINGNCYFFAQILASRFQGDIIYDPIDGHFLFFAYDEELYDWTGRREYSNERKRKMIFWKDYNQKDTLNYSHIWRDCIR